MCNISFRFFFFFFSFVLCVGCFGCVVLGGVSFFLVFCH